MKIKTMELTRQALDWAVAKCLHNNLFMEPYSTSWQLGGPIIERERISVWARSNEWAAESFVCNQEGHEQTGPTPLIAAMRCYVASQLGDEVDVPESLA